MYAHITEFEWDDGNRDKNWKKHGITQNECEEIFFNQPLIVNEDLKHSERENRYQALGKTNESKLLFIVFTLRGNKIRVISARKMNRGEKQIYESNEYS